MNRTWTLKYTVIDTEMDAEKTETLEGVQRPEGVPAILERFIEEGILIGFHLTLNIPEADYEDRDEEK